MWPPKTPYLAVDGIVKIYRPFFEGIVLIQRKNPPLGLALPGGFVDYKEKVEDALIREMKEELNINVKIEKLLNIYSDPTRDKRLHCASAVFVCSSNETPKAADDAKEAFVFKLEEIPFENLVFDHSKIIKDFIKSL